MVLAIGPIPQAQLYKPIQLCRPVLADEPVIHVRKELVDVRPRARKVKNTRNGAMSGKEPARRCVDVVVTTEEERAGDRKLTRRYLSALEPLDFVSVRLVGEFREECHERRERAVVLQAERQRVGGPVDGSTLD